MHELIASAVSGQWFTLSQVEELRDLLFAATWNVRRGLSTLLSYVTYGHSTTCLREIGLGAVFGAFFTKCAQGLMTLTLINIREEPASGDIVSGYLRSSVIWKDPHLVRLSRTRANLIHRIFNICCPSRCCGAACRSWKRSSRSSEPRTWLVVQPGMLSLLISSSGGTAPSYISRRYMS